MKTKKLLISAFLLGTLVLSAETEPDYTTTGSCASYIKINRSDYLGEDSIYNIVRAGSPITVDAVAEDVWTSAVATPISHLANYPNSALDLSKYPQTEAYAYAVYRALWTDDGVYMYISVKDEYIRYNDTGWQWENDGIEFYFSKARGVTGKIQIIIPAMVGMTDPAANYPAPRDFESGSAVGSHPDYKVYGYDSKNWDESLFFWAIRKTSVGWDMEVYMDKDIVTNGNSLTNYGLDKTFAGDINMDVAGLTQTGSPALYVREGTLCLLGYSNQEYASSNYYGTFKLVEGPNAVNVPKSADFSAVYSSKTNEIRITTDILVSSVGLYNVAGQLIPTQYNNAVISLPSMEKGIYMVKAKDQAGNNLGVQKIVVY